MSGHLWLDVPCHNVMMKSHDSTHSVSTWVNSFQVTCECVSSPLPSFLCVQRVEGMPYKQYNPGKAAKCSQDWPYLKTLISLYLWNAVEGFVFTGSRKRRHQRLMVIRSWKNTTEHWAIGLGGIKVLRYKNPEGMIFNTVKKTDTDTDTDMEMLYRGDVL